MLQEGDLAPPFALRDEKNELVALSDYKGKKVVIYFYPKDDTPGCTLESIDFTKNLANFQKMNTEILGISADSVQSHEKFCGKYDLKIKLLSDPDRTVIDGFGVWGEKLNFGVKYMGIIRSTFLIDENGRVEKIWRNIRAEGHAQDVLANLS